MDIPEKLKWVYDLQTTGYMEYTYTSVSISLKKRKIEEKKKDDIYWNSGLLAESVWEYLNKPMNKNYVRLIIGSKEVCIDRYGNPSDINVFIYFDEKSVSEIRKYKDPIRLQKEIWWEAYIIDFGRNICNDGYVVGGIPKGDSYTD